MDISIYFKAPDQWYPLSINDNITFNDLVSHVCTEVDIEEASFLSRHKLKYYFAYGLYYDIINQRQVNQMLSTFAAREFDDRVLLVDDVIVQSNRTHASQNNEQTERTNHNNIQSTNQNSIQVRSDRTVNLIESDMQKVRNGKDVPYFRPTVNQVSFYEKASMPDFQNKSFEAPPKQLAGVTFQRVRHIHKKSVAVDLETGDRYSKQETHRIHQAQEERYQRRVAEARGVHEQTERHRLNEYEQQKQDFERNEQIKQEQSYANARSSVANAALSGAQNGVLAGAVGAGFSNIVDVWRGEKTLKDAGVDTVSRSVSSGIVGAGVGATLQAVQAYGTTHASQTVARVSSSVVSNASVVIPVLFAGYAACKEYKRYYNGEITAADLRKNLVSLVLSTGAGVGGGIGGVCLAGVLFPGVGWAAVCFGALVGTASSMIARSALNEVLTKTIKDDKQEALEEALRYFGLTRDNMHMINQRYRRMMTILHPDVGGTDEAAALANSYYLLVVSAQPFREATAEDLNN